MRVPNGANAKLMETRYKVRSVLASPPIITANISTLQDLFVGQDNTDVNAATLNTASYSSSAAGGTATVISVVLQVNEVTGNGPFANSDAVTALATDSEGNTRPFTIDNNVTDAAGVNLSLIHI